MVAEPCGTEEMYLSLGFVFELWKEAALPTSVVCYCLSLKIINSFIKIYASDDDIFSCRGLKNKYYCAR